MVDEKQVVQEVITETKEEEAELSEKEQLALAEYERMIKKMKDREFLGKMEKQTRENNPHFLKNVKKRRAMKKVAKKSKKANRNKK